MKFTVEAQLLWAEFSEGSYSTIEIFDTGANAFDSVDALWPHIAPGDDDVLGTANPSYVVPGPLHRLSNATHIVLEARSYGQDVLWSGCLWC